jgi:hypothetical protein
MMPGYKVVAGPFNITTKDVSLCEEEKLLCWKAKQQQLQSGVDAKVLLLKDGAWVLRDGKGWLRNTGGASSGEVRSLSKERELERNRNLGGVKIRGGRAFV